MMLSAMIHSEGHDAEKLQRNPAGDDASLYTAVLFVNVMRWGFFFSCLSFYIRLCGHARAGFPCLQIRQGEAGIVIAKLKQKLGGWGKYWQTL